ncbi:MAG: hypothetical protein WC683_05785 [bacterium]
MAATCTEAIKRWKHPQGGYVYALEFSWTAHTDGAVTSAVSTLTPTGNRIQGLVLGIKTQDNGTNPGNGYTATFSDEDGYAFATITGTTGTVTYYGAPAVTAPVPVIDTASISLAVASAGSGGQGLTTLYVWSHYDLKLAA